MDLDLLRRSAQRRGRVTVVREMTGRHATKNAVLLAALAQGLDQVGTTSLTDETGKPYFIFGETPMTDDYVL